MNQAINERISAQRKEEINMKTMELNEMEQVNGGNFFADLEEVLRKIFAEPSSPAQPADPSTPKPAIARGKC